MAEGLRDMLVSIEKSLQSMNNLDIHPRSSQLLLLNGLQHITSCLWTVVFDAFIYDRFQDTTTFEVNMTACDLEKSFIFDNEA